MQRTPTAVQPRLAAPAAEGHTTSVWQVRGVQLWLATLSEGSILHLSSAPRPLFCCSVHVCAVCRASNARREELECGFFVIWSNGHDARSWIRWREFDPHRVQLSLSIYRRIYFYHRTVSALPHDCLPTLEPRTTCRISA